MERYRLAPVREARARDERVQRGELAARVTDARATAERVAATERRVAELRARIAAAPIDAATALDRVRVDRYLARLRRDLDDAIAVRLRAEAQDDDAAAAIDSARGRLTRARADREVIERHFTAWRDARRRLADRRAD